MTSSSWSAFAVSVALLAEGVDRNFSRTVCRFLSWASPSSRRAWIEICLVKYFDVEKASRPPRGGRG